MDDFDPPDLGDRPPVWGVLLVIAASAVLMVAAAALVWSGVGLD